MTDTVVIQFSSSTAWQSALIRKVCHSNFSHVDLRITEGEWEGALIGASDQGPKSPYLAGSPRGVAIRPPDYQDFHIRREAFIKTPVADKVYANAISQLGKKFDDSALGKFIGEPDYDRNWRVDDCWFCSELVAWCFETAGYWAPKTTFWPKDRISPNDLLAWFMWDENWTNRDTFMATRPENVKLGEKER